MRPSVPILLLGLLGFAAAAPGGPPRVAEMVNRGITHYEAGDYPAAAESFAEADVARPDDPWITFDMATAYAARGDLQKATELFGRSALSRDQGLAVRSHYNLGTIAAGKARAVFAERPQDASPEVRQEGLGLLARAVAHYRDCIELDQGHADARHNLELIRLWIKQMQALWEEQDRQKQRQEMNLLEFLAMIEARQRALRLAGKALETESDSPKRRQALTTAATSQRELAREIEPLKEKIGDALEGPQQPAAPPGAAAPPAAEIGEALELLGRLADEAGRAMGQAADRLGDESPAEAVASQTDAVDRLDQIYLGMVPFPSLLQRAIRTQQGLIDQVAPAVERPEEHEKIDLGETAWDQTFVARWSQILPAKAKQGLENLQAAGPGATVPLRKDDEGGEYGGYSEAINKTQEGLKQSMEKAVELGPKVQELTAEAAEKLEEEQPDQALPKQEEALKLLEEIADPLPKQDQQDPQQGDQQEQEQEQGRDQQQSGQQEQEQQARRPQDLSKQQAEAVLRKARERQRERRELEKQLQQYLYRPGTVEKDW